MPAVMADGTKVAYATAGSGPETVAFLADVGFGPWLWGWQAPALAGPCRTVVHATRGTDGSNASGPYDVDRLAADLDAVLADADVRNAHLIGAGLGGMVALRYAREYGRARSLVLIGVAATGSITDDDALAGLYPDGPDRLEASLSLAFSEAYLDATDPDRIVAWRREEDATGDALAGHLEAFRSFDAGALYELDNPALILHGIDDPVVPVEAGEELAAGLPRGRFEAVEGKRLHFLEHSAAVTDAIAAFLDVE